MAAQMAVDEERDPGAERVRLMQSRVFLTEDAIAQVRLLAGRAVALGAVAGA